MRRRLFYCVFSLAIMIIKNIFKTPLLSLLLTLYERTVIKNKILRLDYTTISRIVRALVYYIQRKSRELNSTTSR